MTSIERKAKELVKAFPGISGIEVRDGEIYLGNCATGGTIDNKAACSCSSDDSEYVDSVHQKLTDQATKLGLCVECIDFETFSAYDA